MVLHGEAGEPQPALREALRRRLPDYMVPAAFVVLPALPLTPNGKIDRKALPALDVAAEAPSAAPRTPAEELLAGIWAEVLRRPDVGTDDDFFAAGGHSLLATQVVSRVRRVFGVDLPLRRLFELPTLGALAAEIETLRAGRLALPAPPIARVPRDQSLPASFAQERLWFLDRLQPGGSAYNLPAAVRLHGDLDVPRLAACLDAVVRRHEALRTTFALAGDRPVQVVASHTTRALPVADRQQGIGST